MCAHVLLYFKKLLFIVAKASSFFMYSNLSFTFYAWLNDRAKKSMLKKKMH